MLEHINRIIYLKEVRDTIRSAINSKDLYCIGVDGPTASGKTIFAEILKNEISNISGKKVQIVPLDSLLIERCLREKCLQNLKKISVPFEYEAEMHMQFSKLDELLNLVKLKKKKLSDKEKITLENLYSRSDNGSCNGKLEVNLSEKIVLIFEGHYTTRPEFLNVIDKNFILLANREELIDRKIQRVAGYRNKKVVQEYFELIDEPSYLSNYYRFASSKSFIIDNSDFSSPFSVGYDHIKKLLDTNKFLNDNKSSSQQIREYVFGLHGLSDYKFNDNNIDNLLGELEIFNLYEGRKGISNIFNKNKVPHKIFYFNYQGKNKSEVGLVTKLFGKNVSWILSRQNKVTKHLISWEGGIFIISKGQIEKLPYIINQNDFKNNFNDNFFKNFIDCKLFITSTLISGRLKNYTNYYSFFDNSSQTSFIAMLLQYTQFQSNSLGNFFSISFKGCLNKNIAKYVSETLPFQINKINLINDLDDFYHKKSEKFILSKDFLILRKKLNNQIVKELKDIYFKAKDIKIRSTIIEGLLHEDNLGLVPEDIRKYLNYGIGFLPISMERLYILKRLGIEKTNVLAVNIYDVSKDPIDSSTYLEAAYQKSLPTILQISLNAIGHAENAPDGSNVIGYLEPDKGIKDFTNSIEDSLICILKKNNHKQYPPPFIGIGLDHVDVRGDYPKGRSSRFLKSAIETELITHITLDGSEKFKPKEKIKSEIFKAYKDVFSISLSFLNKNNFNGIDLEFCTGELNYIGNATTPHYPDGEEMSLLPISFFASLEKETDLEYKTNLINSIKLYVGNLGTFHHAKDNERALKITLSSEWQNELLGTNFISPVLHGTTGSSDKTFLLAAKSCQKINIAGSLLKVFLENLNSSQKELLGFQYFDDKSKLLCKKLKLLKKDNVIYNNNELKNSFLRYSEINNVKAIDKKYESIIRKTLYGRNKITMYIFSKLEEMINL